MEILAKPKSGQQQHYTVKQFVFHHYKLQYGVYFWLPFSLDYAHLSYSYSAEGCYMHPSFSLLLGILNSGQQHVRLSLFTALQLHHFNFLPILWLSDVHSGCGCK
jgi:hypothetical protein